jgi:hypothetical protein
MKIKNPVFFRAALDNLSRLREKNKEVEHMKKLFYAVVVAMMLITVQDMATATVFAARGASMPFTTYDSESGVRGGGAVVGTDESIKQTSKSKAYVKLASTGSYLQFSNVVKANRLVVRYNIPSGSSRTLSLYVNGIHNQDIYLEAARCYDVDYSDRKYYHADVKINLAGGETVRLQKDSGDLASSYNIDMIILEVAPADLVKPVNFLSIADYGATGGDTSNDYTAIVNCVSAAKSQNKGVWIPPGTFFINNHIVVPSGLTIRGSGIWYSRILRTNIVQWDTGIFYINGNNVSIYNLRLDSNVNKRNNETYGITGNNFNYLRVENCWFERMTAGLGDWSKYGNNYTFKNNRFMHLYADAIHFPEGGSYCLAENNYILGSGDDGIAIINLYDNPSGGTLPEAVGNIIRFNTIVGNYNGRGYAVTGSRNTVISDNIVDSVQRCGIYIATEDLIYDSWPIVNCKVQRNSVLYDNTSGNIDEYAGAISIVPMNVGAPIDVLVEENYFAYGKAYAVSVWQWGISPGGRVTFNNNVVEGVFPSGNWRNNTYMETLGTGNIGF